MSGVDVIPSGSMSPSRERAVLPPPPTTTTADNVHHDDVSILVSLSARHRITKAGFKFSHLSCAERKQF